MANWNNPTLTSSYTNFVTEVKDRDIETAVWFEGMSPTNLPTNSKRLNTTTGKFEKWNGTAWVDAVATFNFPALGVVGNATVGGTFGVTGTSSFTGAVTVPTPTATGHATTKTYVDTADALKANLASPTFTGIPAAPTAAVDTNTTQIATTAFVIGQAYAKLASPTFTGVPAAPTAAVDTNTTQLATTAFVVGQGYAKLSSPTFTGTVTAAALTASGQVTFSGTGAATMNAGTTAQRPTGVTGMFRFNSTLGKFEGYNGTAWGAVGGGATGGGSDDIFVENGQTVTTNYTITTNKNAMSAGPVTIASGITVTVPSGSTWVVV